MQLRPAPTLLRFSSLALLLSVACSFLPPAAPPTRSPASRRPWREHLPKPRTSAKVRMADTAHEAQPGATLFDQPWPSPEGALAENALVLEVRTFCVLVGVGTRAKGSGFRVCGPGSRLRTSWKFRALGRRARTSGRMDEGRGWVGGWVRE